MAKTRSIRDPLHGFIELTEEEWAIVNSRPFQRLRDIHQLGMGHMVYPGANHTRFEHSLGVVAVSTRMFDRLRSTCPLEIWRDVFEDEDRAERARRTLRLASLLHDVGHGPFSHSGEHLFIPPEHDISKLDDLQARRLAQSSATNT